MTTDKVLALAREAGFYVPDDGEQAYSADSYDGLCTPELVKFAALLQRKMEAENAELRKDAEQRRADYAELQYWRDRHADIMHRRDHVNNMTLSETIYLIRQTAIDSARNK